jgi:hypothetical protein
LVTASLIPALVTSTRYQVAVTYAPSNGIAASPSSFPTWACALGAAEDATDDEALCAIKSVPWHH